MARAGSSSSLGADWRWGRNDPAASGVCDGGKRGRLARPLPSCVFSMGRRRALRVKRRETSPAVGLFPAEGLRDGGVNGSNGDWRFTSLAHPPPKQGGISGEAITPRLQGEKTGKPIGGGPESGTESKLRSRRGRNGRGLSQGRGCPQPRLPGTLRRRHAACDPSNSGSRRPPPTRTPRDGMIVRDEGTWPGDPENRPSAHRRAVP